MRLGGESSQGPGRPGCGAARPVWLAGRLIGGFADSNPPGLIFVDKLYGRLGPLLRTYPPLRGVPDNRGAASAVSGTRAEAGSGAEKGK